MAAPVQSKTRRRLALLFSVPLAFSLIFFIANARQESADSNLLSAQNLRANLSRLLSMTQDAESSERGFLLTGDERYLLPYQQAQTEIDTQIGLCRTLFQDKPEMHAQVEYLLGQVQEKFRQVAETLQAQHDDGFAAALDYEKSGSGQDTMDEIRRTIDTLQLQIGNELQAAHDDQRNLNGWIFVFFLVGTAASIVILISLYNSLIEYIQGQEVAQKQLEAFNVELERRIAERTRELQQSNDELQQFAYVASHDLQEPLRTVTSFTQLLASRYEGKLDEDADEFIGYIVSSARRMTDLINGLLALVRLRKTGQQWEAMPIEELLDEAETSLQAAIREAGATIERTALPALAVDRMQITQLLQNLLSNAMKYRRDVPPEIRVSAHRTASEWIFSVADNGQGFDQQYAERIFGLFQRLHGRDVEGTGMGLSIARKIVERHGGRIWAESKPGVGSTFFFSLPVSLEAALKPTRQPVGADV